MLIGNFKVQDVDGYARLLADRDRFLDRIEDAEAFIANVARINAVVSAHDFGELDQVGGGRE